MYTGKMVIEFKFESLHPDTLDSELANALEALRSVGDAKISKSSISINVDSINKEYLEM